MPEQQKSSRNGQETQGVRATRVRKSGNIDELKARHWAAIVVAGKLLKAEGASYSQQLSAIHAIVQASGSYARLLETTDLARQLTAIQKELKELKKDAGMRMVA